MRILVADEHAIVRDGISTILNQEEDIEVIAQTGSGEEVCQLYFQLEPDILLLELRLAELEGHIVLERIRERAPQARAVFLTMFGGDEDIYRALRAGAQGYLLKEFGREELIDALRKVHEGERAVPPEIAARVTDHIGQSRLTPREMEVLQGIAAGSSNRGIAEDLEVSEGTVKSHINNLLAKIGASSRTDAVVKSLRRGLLRL